MIDSGSTKDQIVVEATRLLDEGGPEAVTLRAVARAVGVSHNAPYKHFEDKKALLSAVAQASFRELALGYVSDAEAATTPISALRLAVKRYIAFAKRFPSRYQLLFSDPNIGTEEGQLKLEAIRTLAAITQLVKNAQRAGQLKRGDPSKITGLLYSTVHGLIDLEISGRTQISNGMKDIEALSLLMVDLLSQKPRR